MTEKFYLEDILSQKAELQKMMAHYRNGQELEKLERLRELKDRKIIFSGMGSSHFCAYGAAVRLQQHGISSQVISTGELIYYEKECLEKDTAVSYTHLGHPLGFDSSGAFGSLEHFYDA